jgi:hypothetical protein
MSLVDGLFARELTPAVADPLRSTDLTTIKTKNTGVILYRLPLTHSQRARSNELDVHALEFPEACEIEVFSSWISNQELPGRGYLSILSCAFRRRCRIVAGERLHLNPVDR